MGDRIRFQELNHTQKRKAERKGLWEVRFILSGVPLPDDEDELFVNEKLKFVRLPKEEVRLRLPTRAFVKIVGRESNEVRSLAERYLKDFIGLYSNMVPSVIRVVRDDGASELPSEFVPSGTKHLRSAVWAKLFVKQPTSKEELHGSAKLVAKIMNLIDLDSEGMSYLRIAIDYFLNSKVAKEIEDKLINCMIAIEALFGEKDELTYRISHRVACLLGKGDDAREDIFKNMKKLYAKRSALVHGKKTIVSWDDIRKAHSYLRDSINRFLVLSQKYSRENILQTLDNAVINDNKRKELQNECEELLQKTRKDID